MVQLVVGFLFNFILVLIPSYVFIRAWRNLPASRKARFWLGVSSVTLGTLWYSLLMSRGILDIQDYSPTIFWTWILVWSVIFSIGLLYLFSLRHFFRSLFSWRILKRCLLTFVLLAALIATFYAEENWRGKRAWENYRREWEANGEKFDLISFAPPLVPDEQNFAMAPVVVSSYAAVMDAAGHPIRPIKTNIVNRLMMELQRTNLYFTTNETIGSWQKAKLTNLKPWQDYYRKTIVTNICYWKSGTNKLDIIHLDTSEFPITIQPQSPAADVLLALSRYDKAIEELRQAGQRPFSRFPLNYQTEYPAEMLLPHLAALKRCGVVLQLRAIAEMQAGQTEQALADVKLMLRLAESIRSEPMLISHLVRMALVNLAIQPVWEGLVEHRWSDAQLKELNQELQKLDFISGLQFSLNGEQAAELKNIEHMRKHRDEISLCLLFAVYPEIFKTLDKMDGYFSNLPMSVNKFLDSLGRWLPNDLIRRTLQSLPPDGWYEQNKVAIAKIFQEKLFQIVSPDKHLISRQVAVESAAFFERNRTMLNLNPQNVLIYMLLPAVTTAAERTAVAQNSVDMANLACALERYRLLHGEYPETLGALMPQFIEKIPPDVVDGQPLHYRRTNDGRFLLYSVGWNGKDDGGVVELNEYGSLRPDLGDWVWKN